MTEKLYFNDSYVKECDARINKITERGIILDKTIFYASGGGQPGDSGIITVNNMEYRVLDTVKENEDVLQIMDGKFDDLREGDHCHCQLDWEKRYNHMKFHTAIHLIDGMVNKMPDYEGLITGSQIYDDRARVDFSMENFSTETAQEIINKVNEVIKEDHDIEIKYMPGEEAIKIPNLSRTAPGRELLNNLDVVRIIEIVGIDEQADGGTHVRNTTELGQISLQKIENKGKRNKRLYFTLVSY